MEDIHSKLQEIRNPIHAIGVLIREMDYETDADMERGESSNSRAFGLGERRLGKRSHPSSSSPYPVVLSFSSSPKYAHEPRPAVW